MANYRSVFVMLLAGVIQFKGCVCGSFCYELRYFYDFYSSSYSYYYVFYDYCTHGCCGYESSRSCCSSYNDNESAVVGVIVGSTIGGICFLGIIISVTICFICNLKNKNQVGGIVVGPPTNGTNNIGMSNLPAPVQTEPYFQQHDPPHPPSYLELPNVPSQASPTLPPSDVLRNI